MKNELEKLGTLIDEIDSLGHSLELPLGDKVHVDMLKLILPEKVKEFKEVYVKISGENPWE